MVRPLQAIRSELHSRLLELRNLDRFVHDEIFQKTFNSATNDQKLIAQQLIEKQDRYGLDRWVKTILRASRIIEEFAIAELRTLCGELGVKSYRNMTKQMLVSAIRQQEKCCGQARNSSSDITALNGNAHAHS